MGDRRETVAEFAERIGRSERQVGRDLRDGMPHAKVDGRVTIPVRKALQWREKNRVVEASSGSPLTDARTRRELAHARLEELKVWREEGLTVRVAVAEKLVAASYMRVRLKLDALASRLAPAVVGVTTIEEAHAKIAPLIAEIREELRALGDREEDGHDEPDVQPF